MTTDYAFRDILIIAKDAGCPTEKMVGPEHWNAIDAVRWMRDRLDNQEKRIKELQKEAHEMMVRRGAAKLQNPCDICHATGWMAVNCHGCGGSGSPDIAPEVKYTTVFRPVGPSTY